MNGGCGDQALTPAGPHPPVICIEDPWETQPPKTAGNIQFRVVGGPLGSEAPSEKSLRTRGAWPLLFSTHWGQCCFLMASPGQWRAFPAGNKSCFCCEDLGLRT